jgi:hypothetical protein
VATRIRDIIAAEEALDEALAEQERQIKDASQWAAFESVDPQGRKQLNMNRVHFDLQELAASKVEAAAQRLTWVKRSFFEGR